MDWRLSVAQPPDYALNYSPALLFSRHIHHTDRRHAVRIEPYGARPPHFAPTDSGRWKPTWLEFDSLARQTPLRVLGLSVDWLDAQRLRVSSVVHVAGF
ncbi:hypothetical protein HS125_03070 [bacterium]|nr:hypothetical protein [bacterium]